jgi:hypothetical protein
VIKKENERAVIARRSVARPASGSIQKEIAEPETKKKIALSQGLNSILERLLIKKGKFDK